MDVWEAIRKRRSIKKFADRELGKEVILRLVEAGRLAPSGQNKQPWEFVITTDRTKLQELSKCSRGSAWLAGAAAGIAVVGDPETGKYWLEDCCVAAENMWLAATAMGLGFAWAAIYQTDKLESDRREGFVREVLKIPEKYRVVLVAGLGYPVGEPNPKEFRDKEKMIHWEQF